MNDEDFRKFGVNTVIDIAKQLITLSSAFIVVTATVTNIFVDRSTVGYGLEVFGIAVLSWLFSVVSICAGILALGAIATSAHDLKKFDVDETFTKWSLRTQQVAFVLSFGLFAIFASINAID